MTHTWTPADDTLLRKEAKGGVTGELCRRLGRTRHAVRNRMHRLGLTDYGRRLQADEPTAKAKAKLADAVEAAVEAHPRTPLPVEASDYELHLERRVQVLGEELSAYKSRTKKLHRDECLLESLLEEIRAVSSPLKPIPPLVRKPRKAGAIQEDLVVHLSDEHADQIVLPHRVNGLEEYNLNVALARAEKFVETIIDVSQSTLSNYEFQNLWILAYGDHINGEIHGSTQNSTFRNAIRNSFAVGQMHALMIRDLAPYFKQVNVVYIAGNHGRFGHKKDYVGAWQNWDYAVAEVARGALRDLPHVQVHIPDSYSIILDINGWNFHLSHGDDIKCTNSIPYYGLERRTRRLSELHGAAGKRIHYYCIGHFHSLSSLPTTSGEILMNGSWKATDEWAYDALGAALRPMQWIHGVHRDKGISWRLPAYLKFDGDAAGPKRYKIDLAEAE